MVQDALAKGDTRSYECAHHDRVILISVVPQAGLAGVNLYGRDDTERKRAERELIAASEAALAAARMKSEFLANISHELRTPLNGVLGMLQLIEDTRLDEEQRDYVRVAAGSGNALLDLINDVLDFSKIEAGGLELERIPLCAHDIAETACQMLAEQAHEKGLEIGCLTERSVPRWVKGDPTRLRQVLINLTANAVKFTDKGSVLVGVRRVSSDDETGTITLKFTVTDTGIGIDESARERIFDAFTQADGSVTRKHGGTGLGLTISRELVRAMGGEITLVSELGAGSEFSFTTTFLPAEQEVLESHAAGFPGRHAVVLSANDGYGAVLCHQLETLGIRTHLTASATAARACARDTGAGFLFVDHDAVRGSELARLVTELGSSTPPPALVCLLPFGPRARSELPPSTRTLMKPVRLAQLMDLLSATDPPRSPRPARPARLGPQADLVRRVLVVDDNAVNRRIALAMLVKLGVEAESAASGIECLDRLDTEAFSLVLMDCHMPILDGYETTARLRRRPRGAGIPVVAMTANAGPEERTRCIEAGMNGHLAKPMTLSTLSAALERWLAPQSTTTIDAA